jgi:hypothetical protein
VVGSGSIKRSAGRALDLGGGVLEILRNTSGACLVRARTGTDEKRKGTQQHYEHEGSKGCAPTGAKIQGYSKIELEQKFSGGEGKKEIFWRKWGFWTDLDLVWKGIWRLGFVGEKVGVSRDFIEQGDKMGGIFRTKVLSGSWTTFY